ncbi:MAG TPA: CBS domain-containing protein [Acidimicrobiia bacterium]|nr:CBS domain-containing protein [Acidimicrobiia bacterium]
MQLREFIHTPAVTCPSGTSLWAVAQLMDADNVGCVVVIDPDRHIAGIVTDRDLALRGLGNKLDSDTPVEQIMNREVISVPDDQDVFEAAARMASSGRRRLPVLDNEGNLKGIVALDDLTVLFAHQVDSLAQTVATATGLATST